MVILLPPVPGPKIRGIDPELLKVSPHTALLCCITKTFIYIYIYIYFWKFRRKLAKIFLNAIRSKIDLEVVRGNSLKVLILARSNIPHTARLYNDNCTQNVFILNILNHKNQNLMHQKCHFLL